MATDDERGGKMRTGKVTAETIDREIQLQRVVVCLDALHEIVRATHYHVSDGGIVRDGAGKPVENAEPKLRALTEIRSWMEWDARLRGTGTGPAPVVITMNGREVYEFLRKMGYTEPKAPEAAPGAESA